MSVLQAILQYREQEKQQQAQQGQAIQQAFANFQNSRQQAVQNQMSQLQTKIGAAENGIKIGPNGELSRDTSLLNPLDELIQKGKAATAQKAINDIGGGQPLNNGVPITDINSIQDPNMRPLLQGVLDYRQNPAQIASLRGNQREDLVKMATALDPSYDQTQFPARAQFRKSLTSGQLSKNIVSANTLIGHLGALKDSFDELNKSRTSNDIPAINAVENMGLSAMGKGVVKSAKLNADAVSNELETLFRGTNGSLAGVEDFKKNFSLNGSPEQQKAVIQKAIDLVASRVSAIDSQNQEVMGKPRDFSVLNDKSKAIIAKLGADPEAIDSFTNQSSKKLDAVTAAKIFEQAGKDPTKAREIAKQQGYTF